MAITSERANYIITGQILDGKKNKMDSEDNNKIIKYLENNICRATDRIVFIALVQWLLAITNRVYNSKLNSDHCSPTWRMKQELEVLK